MNMKGVFEHVSRNSLLRTMDDIGAKGDLMHSTESFMPDRTICLVIDKHKYSEVAVVTGVT